MNPRWSNPNAKSITHTTTAEMEREAETTSKGRERERKSREMVVFHSMAGVLGIYGSQSKNERWNKDKEMRKKKIRRKESGSH